MKSIEPDQGENTVSDITRVIKIGDDGKVTFSMPDMVGRYLLVEEREGQIVLSPYDLRWQSPCSSIAKVGTRLHFVPHNEAVSPVA